MLKEILHLLQSHWRDTLEILLLTIIIYKVYLAINRTSNNRIILLVLFSIIITSLISQILKLEVISWVLQKLIFVIIFSIIVIFHQEIRRMLIVIGTNKLFSFSNYQKDTISLIVDSITSLSKKRHGALIAIERKNSLTEYADTGVKLECLFSQEVISSIFFPKSPLHDGGVILQGNSILAAACIFPVSQRELNDKTIGLRHRAGLGISEETDSFIIIVSEETGNITICFNNEMHRNMSAEDLKLQIEKLILEDV